MKSLILTLLSTVLFACASSDRVELGNQGYAADPIRIYLMPMEGIAPAYATFIAREIESRHKLKTKATTELGRQSSMFDTQRRQQITNEIAKHAHDVIQRIKQPHEHPFVIVLTQQDVNARESDLRFLFASHFKGISVLSTARIDPVNYGLPRDDKRRDERLMKLINKAIGQQVHGYPISSDRKSVMYGPIMSVDDLDAIGAWY
jgi:predicted Zn-dependent protease